MTATIRRTRVLFAPTWEGFYEDSCYSSLLSMGEAITSFFEAASERYVLHFKSHPLTGSVDVRYQVAEQNIIERARRVGGAALVMTPGRSR